MNETIWYYIMGSVMVNPKLATNETMLRFLFRRSYDHFTMKKGLTFIPTWRRNFNNRYDIER